MASEKVTPAVMPEEKARVEAAAAAAKEEVLNKKTWELLMNVRSENIIVPNPDAEIIKGTANRAGVWGHSPAQFEFNAASTGRFQRTAKLAFGKEVNRVERVHARLINGTKLVVIQPAASTDLSALQVNRYAGDSGSWVNLLTLLAEAELTIDTGFRQYYEVAYVPQGSPLWPGIFFDLSKPKDRRAEGKKKAEEGDVTEGARNKTASAKNKGAAKKKGDPMQNATDTMKDETSST